MNAFYSAVKRFALDDDGITAIEYGLIAALMAGALGTIIGLLDTGLTTTFNGIVAKMATALT